MLLWSDGQQGRMDTRREPDHDVEGSANPGDDDDAEADEKKEPAIVAKDAKAGEKEPTGSA